MDFLSRTDKSYRKLGYKRSIYWAPIIVRVNCKSGFIMKRELSLKILKICVGTS